MKLGSTDIGKAFLGATEIGKAYLGSTLVYEAGGVTPPSPAITFTMTSADLFASKSIGGYINTSTLKWKTSPSYYGIIVDIQGYEGANITFTRNETSPYIRYAYLTSAEFAGGTLPSYSQQSGYDTLITNTEDQQIFEKIPSDAHYLFIYTYTSGNNMAPTVSISGVFVSHRVNLLASLFSTNTTIGANGTVYTGSTQAPTTVCSNYLSVAEYAFCQQLNFIPNSYATGISKYKINVAEYTTRKQFIRRNTYTEAPYSQTLSPACSFVRIIVVCQQEDGTELSGDIIRFDNDDIQTLAISTI